MNVTSPDDKHFAFGRNWATFAAGLDETQIAQATEDLARLVGESLEGKSFCDIGSGSGLSSLAALRLGAKSVFAIDVDEDSVATTRAVLQQFAPDKSWSCRQQSVLELAPSDTGLFDVVYSWGVLHHTGQMLPAIGRAAALVAPDGLFSVALYGKTPLCAAWRAEKALYSRMPALLQTPIRWNYMGWLLLALLVRGRNPVTHVRDYSTDRGMRWSTDVHDWLGGYPYESISSDDMLQYMNTLGFSPVRTFCASGRLGLLGTGCDEFTFSRNPGVPES